MSYCKCETCKDKPPQTYCWCLQHRRHVYEGHEDRHPGHQVFRFGLRWPPKKRGSPLERAIIPDLPASVDLRPTMKKGGFVPFDQAQLGSCTANCGAEDKALTRIKQGAYTGPYSRLFLYYLERVILGTVNQDSGAEMANIGEVFAQSGICLEKTWPYTISKFTQKPPAAAYTEALNYKSNSTQIFVSVGQFQQALYDCSQQPLLGSVRLGFPVPQSFMDAVNNGGLVPIPGDNESLLGGHAMLEAGYDNQYIYALQSWGNTGDMSSGLSTFKFPYAFFSSNFVKNNGGTDNYQQLDLPAVSPPPPPPPPPPVNNLTLSLSTSTLTPGISFIASVSGTAAGNTISLQVLDSNQTLLDYLVRDVAASSSYSFNVTYPTNISHTGSGYVQYEDYNQNLVSNNVPVTIQSASPCAVGNGIAKAENYVLKKLGRRGRFMYYVPGKAT